MLKRISCVALCLFFSLAAMTQQVTALEVISISDLPFSAENTLPAQQPSESATDSVASGQPFVPEVSLNGNNNLPNTESDFSIEENSSLVLPEDPCVIVNNSVIADDSPVIINNTTYVSLRSVTAILRPDAVVNWENDHAVVTAEGLDISIYPNSSYIIANGRYLYLPDGVQIIDGSTELPIRVIAKAFDAQVEWDPETKNTLLTTGSGAIVSGDEFYHSDELYWLSRIIYSESGNQPLEGKIAVGNVIQNRVNNPIFPDTMYDVIFQKNQFAPTRNGTINRNPNEGSVIAAKLCLDGAVILPTALWFNRAGVTCWASRNKDCIAVIGNHAFYA